LNVSRKVGTYVKLNLIIVQDARDSVWHDGTMASPSLGLRKQRHTIAKGLVVFSRKDLSEIRMGSPQTGVSNTRGVDN